MGRRKIEKICGIYKIENLVNGKVYIGSSINIKERWRRHKKDLRKNKHHSIYLQRSWDKYGEVNFKFEVVELLINKEELLEKEQLYIDKYDSYNNGYNINEFADRHELSTETKIKIGKSSKGRNVGDKNKTSKINEIIALKIIDDLQNTDLNVCDIALKYKCSQGIVHHIHHHKSWIYLTENVIFPKKNTNYAGKRSRLNNEKVLLIIKDLLDCKTNKEIILSHNVTNNIIHNIRTKHTWKNLSIDIVFPNRR